MDNIQTQLTNIQDQIDALLARRDQLLSAKSDELRTYQVVLQVSTRESEWLDGVNAEGVGEFVLDALYDHFDEEIGEGVECVSAYEIRPELSPVA